MNTYCKVRSHKTCRRCGGSGYNLTMQRCARCNFGRSSKMKNSYRLK